MTVGVRERIASTKQSLSAFLKQQAPLWHQVGRVCFHLAEIGRIPTTRSPFLRLMLRASNRRAKVQYQPLSRALQEYAGVKDKKTLVKLLSPVHKASQRSGFVRELVESGDIYQPLAWTPSEAYRFLSEMPLLDECGVLVRLPDWWKKRPRPRVGVTVGREEDETLRCGQHARLQGGTGSWRTRSSRRRSGTS